MIYKSVLFLFHSFISAGGQRSKSPISPSDELAFSMISPIVLSQVFFSLVFPAFYLIHIWILNDDLCHVGLHFLTPHHQCSHFALAALVIISYIMIQNVRIINILEIP